MALNYPGIRILMIRCHYPELEENLVRPILKWVPEEMYSYNGTLHLMRFNNGSEIKFGHYDGDAAENEYQGAQYDCVFIDEATQLSERAFSYLSGCVRGVGNYPRRMYLTWQPRRRWPQVGKEALRQQEVHHKRPEPREERKPRGLHIHPGDGRR